MHFRDFSVSFRPGYAARMSRLQWRWLALVFAASSVLAQSPSPKERADQLFGEAMSLFEAKKIAPACAKFAASYRLDPANGTLQNLATCHEAEGKPVLAWREWSELVTRASNAGQPARVTLAREHLAELARVVPRVKFRVGPRSNVEVVEIDGEAASRQVWEDGTAVEAGAHELRFSSARRVTEVRTVETLEPVTLEIELPTLADEPAPPASSPAIAPGAPERKAIRSSAPSRTGWIVGGAGLLAIGAGGYFGIRAIGLRSDSDHECPREQCTQAGLDLNDEANSNAWIANVGIGVGLVALGVGVYLVVTDRSSRTAGLRGLQGFRF